MLWFIEQTFYVFDIGLCLVVADLVLSYEWNVCHKYTVCHKYICSLSWQGFSLAHAGLQNWKKYATFFCREKISHEAAIPLLLLCCPIHSWEKQAYMLYSDCRSSKVHHLLLTTCIPVVHQVLNVFQQQLLDLICFLEPWDEQHVQQISKDRSILCSKISVKLSI